MLSLNSNIAAICIYSNHVGRLFFAISNEQFMVFQNKFIGILIVGGWSICRGLLETKQARERSIDLSDE